MIELTAKINEINKFVGRLTVPAAPAPVPIVSNYDLDTETEVETTPAIRTKYELVFDGSHHIILGDFAPNQDSGVEVTFKRSSTGDTVRYLFGHRYGDIRTDGGSVLVGYSDSQTHLMFGGVNNQEYLSETCEVDVMHTANLSKDGYYLDGIQKRSYSAMTFALDNYDFCIGTNNNFGTLDWRRFKGSIYNFKIFQGSVLVRNLYPAETLNGGTVTAEGLVDIITGNFYGMEGTA